MLSTHEDLRRKIEAMEKNYDEQFAVVFEAIKQLLDVERKPKGSIAQRLAGSQYDDRSLTGEKDTRFKGISSFVVLGFFGRRK